ncbi:DUF4230 domain-containing protein [Mesobacillus foraminis]|uniref:DUF4230 domain-containing protein n=1 Tax=Mesobacillus foraminis TaxID=279826 RepID=UPI001BE62BBF|nr:DUF4230 domain-containing protein [Mesobacillus foraminis]MBT2756524.1 DUF4230 domain-containing protein [Mesobacillus foraminis]
MRIRRHHQETLAATEGNIKGEVQTPRTLSSNHERNYRTSLPYYKRKMKYSILTIAATLLLMSGLGTFTFYKLFSGSTSQSESITIVEQVQELATLATAEAVVTTVIKEEDNKLFNKELNIHLPGTKRTVLLVVPATVLAGVDLQNISETDIQVNEEQKEISLTIPHASIIQEPSIQMDKVETYSEEGLFRSEVNWEEGFDLAAAAKQEIEKEAQGMGLLEKAEDSAVKVISNFYHNLGYSVKIEFK